MEAIEAITRDTNAVNNSIKVNFSNWNIILLNEKDVEVLQVLYCL